MTVEAIDIDAELAQAEKRRRQAVDAKHQRRVQLQQRLDELQRQLAAQHCRQSSTGANAADMPDFNLHDQEVIEARRAWHRAQKAFRTLEEKYRDALRSGNSEAANILWQEQQRHIAEINDLQHAYGGCYERKVREWYAQQRQAPAANDAAVLLVGSAGPTSGRLGVELVDRAIGQHHGYERIQAVPDRYQIAMS